MKVTAVSDRPIAEGLSLVEVTCDSGLTGTATLETPALTQMQALARQHLIGQDPRSVTALVERMSRDQDRTGWPAAQAVASLDMALWDLKARHGNEPLWRTLGGSSPKLLAHTGALGVSLTDADLGNCVESVVRQRGFRCAVVAIGDNDETNLRRLKIVSERLGDHIGRSSLMVEASGTWTSQQAVQHLRAIESQFDVTWVSGATRSEDDLAAKRLRDSVPTAVAAGRKFHSLAQFQPHLHHRALDLVEVNPAKLGFTAALQVADAAFGLEIPVIVQALPGNMHVHLAAALVYCMSVEIGVMDSFDAALESGITVQGGWARASNAVGNSLRVRGAVA